MNNNGTIANVPLDQFVDVKPYNVTLLGTLF